MSNLTLQKHQRPQGASQSRLYSLATKTKSRVESVAADLKAKNNTSADLFPEDDNFVAVDKAHYKTRQGPSSAVAISTLEDNISGTLEQTGDDLKKLDASTETTMVTGSLRNRSDDGKDFYFEASQDGTKLYYANEANSTSGGTFVRESANGALFIEDEVSTSEFRDKLNSPELGNGKPLGSGTGLLSTTSGEIGSANGSLNSGIIAIHGGTSHHGLTERESSMMPTSTPYLYNLGGGSGGGLLSPHYTGSQTEYALGGGPGVINPSQVGGANGGALLSPILLSEPGSISLR